MKKDKSKKKKTKGKVSANFNKKYIDKKKKLEISPEEKQKNRKQFIIGFIVFICIMVLGLVKKSFQNDTFYTIKIGELIINNGIDMMDHFSYHVGLAYTYPHWLYDVFIYLVFKLGGFTGIYISTIMLLIILLVLVFKVNRKITDNYSVAAFATFICSLAIAGFATARAQLVSFIFFALEVYFIEMFLKDGKKKYLFGLLIISLLLCNIHVAVWPFYFIVYLPYLAEYIISWICELCKKKETKFWNFMRNKFITEKNDRIKVLFLTMIVSFLTGFLTPIGDTPYTYLIKTMMGNSQSYIQEHQLLSWINSPFTIIIAFETIFLALFNKVKLRDLFMICGLVLMSIFSTRHLSLLALLGTICFARIFSMFLENFGFTIDDVVLRFFCKKRVAIISFICIIIFSSLMFRLQLKQEFVQKEFYPIEAVKYIKENIDISKMKIFNDYNFGSYLLYNDIPVFIDSRADLYTKQFSGFDYDVFDDYIYINTNYQEKFNFYGITHILIYKEKNTLDDILKKDSNYKNLYDDENFILYEKLSSSNVIININ